MRLIRRRKSGSIEEADRAVAQAARGTEQAAEAKTAAQAKLYAERRYFRRMAAGSPDVIAAAIEASLKEGRRA